MGCTLRVEPHALQFIKYRREMGSRVSSVSSDLHMWQVTYSPMYLRSSDSMYLGWNLPASGTARGKGVVEWQQRGDRAAVMRMGRRSMCWGSAAPAYGAAAR